MDAQSPTAELRSRLLESGMTQGQLAQAIGLESPTSVCLILNDRRRLTPRMARRMATALGYKPEDTRRIETEAALCHISKTDMGISTIPSDAA